MKLAKAAAGAIVGVAFGANVAFADEVNKLSIATWFPPTHPINTELLTGYIDEIEKLSKGKIEAELVFGLTSPPSHMDIVLDGIADMAIIFHGYTPGRFNATRIVELPGYSGTAEASSVAYWRVYEKYLKDLDEHKGLKLVALTTHGPGQIHSRLPIDKLSDLQGLKTRIGGGTATAVGAAVGLTGIQVPAPKVYETLDSGAADAVAMNTGERAGFKLDEVAPTLYEMPGGFYRGSFAIIMNQESFDRLPADVRETLDNDFFGEPASRFAGEVWDTHDARARAKTAENPEATIVIASAQDQEAFAKIAQYVNAELLAEISDLGIDAAAAASMVQAEMNTVN